MQPLPEQDATLSAVFTDAVEQMIFSGAPKPEPENIHFAVLTPNRAQRRLAAKARWRNRGKVQP